MVLKVLKAKCLTTTRRFVKLQLNTEGNLEEVFKSANGYWYDDETGEDTVFDRLLVVTK